MEYKVIEGGGITSPKGFTAGAVYVGVKSRKSQKPDVAVLYSETEASCACGKRRLERTASSTKRSGIRISRS